MKKRLSLTVLSIALFFASCQQDEFELRPAANDIFHVKNGDYLIPVQVRGNTASKKILLYIQGGPGYASLDFSRVDYPGWKNSLETEYAVAYYDQRGTGNKQGDFTQGESVLTTWIDDLHKVATFLKATYQADIIMMGHSFGGSLMYRYMIAKGNSAVPSKYISIDAPATTDSKADTLRWKFRREFLFNTANLEISRGTRVSEWHEVLEWLNDTPVIGLVEGSNPYLLTGQWNAYVEKLIYVDYPEKPVTVRDYLTVAFASSYNPLAYLNSGYANKVVDEIFDEEESDFLTSKLPQITDQQILLIGGRYDDICPPEELSFIFNQITSPQKTMKVIDHAGHTPFADQPVEFFNSVKQFVQQ